MAFDENNPDVTESSEDENCNKKLIKDDAGSSQNKSYNKHKAHSLNECFKNMVKKLRTIPGHLNNDKSKKKTLNAQPDAGKIPHEIHNTETESKKNARIYVCAAK